MYHPSSPSPIQSTPTHSPTNQQSGVTNLTTKFQEAIHKIFYDPSAPPTTGLPHPNNGPVAPLPRRPSYPNLILTPPQNPESPPPQSPENRKIRIQATKFDQSLGLDD